MRQVTCSMSLSLDGYIAGPDGDFAWSPPDEEVFRFATEEVRGLGVHLLGRRLYEAMTYWEIVDLASLTDLQREFATLWTSLPKVVFSTTLTSVIEGYQLAAGRLAEEIERWRATPGQGNIGIGGAALAAEVSALDLVDEYRLRVYPVLVGGGTPFFPRDERRRDLEFVDSRTFGSGVVHLHYRVRR
jgi:dihydrofolate reductase